MDAGELVAVGRALTCLELGTIPRLTLLLSFVSGMRVRAMGLYYVGQSTENPFSVLCIFRIPGRIMHLIYGL